ncbi:hypothetical protein BC831DRAFT_508836 [Entophlyctis helioformis]|nr:hypothetical protein BC831DRAFT_508836 [Entophlyctis helioformis]
MPLHEALVLYRSIRRLHRRLPAALKFMGDQYLKDEFVRHKAAQQEYIPGFIKGWTAYRDTLADQISRAEEAAALADADAL